MAWQIKDNKYDWQIYSNLYNYVFTSALITKLIYVSSLCDVT